MKYLLAIASLMAISMPVQAETVYLVIKSVKGKYNAGGVSLHSLPMKSMEQCEEAGALIVTSTRFDVRSSSNDGFECVEGK